MGEYEALQGWLDDKLHDWRRQRQYARYGDTNQVTNGHSAPDDEDLSTETASYRQHLAKEYHIWINLSLSERQEQWHRECARAFAQEQEKHGETKKRLEQAEQALRLLRNHLIQYSATSQSSLAAQYLPELLPLSRDLITHLPEYQTPQTWDYDFLLDKWRTRIQSARSSQSSPLPPSTTSTAWHAAPVNHPAGNINDQAPPAFTNVSLPTPNGQAGTSAPDYDREEDLADAPGEDEDEEDGYGDELQYQQEQPGKGSKSQQKKNQGSVDGAAGRGSRRSMRMGLGEGVGEMEIDSG